MCALWPWPRRYDLGSRLWQILRSKTYKWVKLEWGCPNGTKYPPRQPIQTPQVMSLKPFYLTAWFYLTARVYRQTDRVIPVYPPYFVAGGIIISRSNLALRSYGPDMDFQYMCTVTLTLEIWPWIKVITHPLVIDNKCVKYYPDPTWQWGVMARTRISSMCALWPWPWRYDLGWRLWDTLGSWTTIVWNIIQIQLGSEELWPGHGFQVCVHCDLDLENMTLGQSHDTPLVHGQQLCEILSRSNLAARSYGPDTDFQYVCTVTLTLEIWPWVKAITHLWVMDNNCVKLYPDRTREYKAIAWTQCEQTDRQTDGQTGWFLYTPQTLFARGIISILLSHK